MIKLSTISYGLTDIISSRQNQLTQDYYEGISNAHTHSSRTYITNAIVS